MAKFDPQPTLNPEPIVTKFATRDYVADIYYQKKIWAQSAQGVLPPTYVKYTPKTFECLLLFFVSSEPPETSPFDRFSRLIRHTTLFCAWKCLLGEEKK